MIRFIHLSDIHYEKNIELDQKRVTKAFINDIAENCRNIDRSKTYLIISGDLVQAGNKDNFDAFKNEFLKPIEAVGFSYSNMIFVPGNHDLNRQCIEDKEIEHNGFLNVTKSTFLKYIRRKTFSESILVDKFQDFVDFYHNINSNYTSKDVANYSISLDDKVHLLCLNSALCSFGGYKDIDDKTRNVLNIDTLKVEEWLENVKERKGIKLILMHHPLDYLSEWVQKELRILLKGIKPVYILNGHVHDQDINRYVDEQRNDNIIVFTAPQLFCNNNDELPLLGYSMMDIDENEDSLQVIQYRQWSYKQNRFILGIDFVENGVYSFISKNKNVTKEEEYQNIDVQKYEKNIKDLLDLSLITDNYVLVIRNIEQLKKSAIQQSNLRVLFYHFLCEYIRKRRSISSSSFYQRELEWLSYPNDIKIVKSTPYDVQLMFTILYRDCLDLFSEISNTFDFSGLELYNINFVGMYIKNANFSYSMLQHSSMFKVDKLQFKTVFENCIFNNAFLDASNMNEAVFKNCKFIFSNMRWANMYGVNLKGCHFIGCQMVGIILSEAHIEDCVFEECNLGASELMNLHFGTNTVFLKCDFSYASIFSESILNKVKVKCELCDFTGAEKDLRYYRNHGRIKRFLIYRKNINVPDIVNLNIDNKWNSRNTLEYRIAKYYKIMKTIRDYCLPNGVFDEVYEIQLFVEGKIDEILNR